MSGRAKEKGCLSQDGPTVYNVKCMEQVKKQTVRIHERKKDE